MMWNLYEDEEFLKPLKFSNGKTQEDVVREVLEAIKEGHKVIFINGKCGTGKSAIALNIAKKIGKTSIIVPGKNLQQQYKKDYENNKYLLKKDNTKLKISVITGRNNHKCKFLEDDKNAIPAIKKEINSKLYDIFSGKREKLNRMTANDFSADNFNIPCRIEIKEKNISKIKEYLKQNKKVNIADFERLSDIKRIPIASLCPYWSPVFPEDFESKYLGKVEKRKYKGLNGKEFIFYLRKPGCKFYEQFNSYIDSDVIVFNSLKYEFEFAMNRKPFTEAEIIDECDEFLDSFANQRTINIDRLQNSLSQIPSSNRENFQKIQEIMEILKHLKTDKQVLKSLDTNEIIPLKKTGIYDLINIFLKEPGFLEDIDEDSYAYDIEKTAFIFEHFLDESYVIFNKKEENLIANIVTTNLSKKFKWLKDKNKVLILMSGTIHSKDVLKDIFGIEEFKLIEAETKQPGEIRIRRTGLEMDCKYSNFSNNKFTRKDYLSAFDRCIDIAEKPVLVHVNGFSDLASEDEIKKFNLKNFPSRRNLIESQNEDKEGLIVQNFKNKKTDILFSTRVSRGMDFPGEQCRSIIFTKYPNPDIKNSFWRILGKTRPMHYWNFYRDKARRELLQKVYRGVRHEGDYVYVLSPDKRVTDFFEKTN
ncbi:MAG: helicase C-terminal domain-containing protein [Candidatus Diapherotrites archaeon]